jgi:hypothetical protein
VAVLLASAVALIPAATVGALASAGTNPSPPRVAPLPSSAKLTWARPKLTNPITVEIADSGLAAPSLPGQNAAEYWVIRLQPNQDYILELHHREQKTGFGGLSIHGGRNVVIVGGEIEIVGATNGESERDAFTFSGQTGTVHIEGVWVHGKPLRGFVFNSPEAVFQVQNVRVEGIYLWEHDFNTWHSDAFLTWDSPRALRFDRYTTDYDNTGFALYKSETGTYPRQTIFRRTNIRNSQSFAGGASYLYRGSAATRVVLDRVYAETGWGVDSARLGSYKRSLREGFGGPDAGQGGRPRVKNVGGGRRRGSYVLFVEPAVDNVWGVGGALGRITYGIPPAGDFVPRGVAGAQYRSPGYAGARR